MTDLATELAALRAEIDTLRTQSLAAFNDAHRTALTAQTVAMWAMSILKTDAPDQFGKLLLSQRLLVQKYRTEGQAGPLEMSERILAVLEEAQSSAPLLADPTRPGPK